ncbi:MAG: tripartite tricarboxylate transporter substrate binding protein [Burkholderiales bacterium]|nr:tripartite tricarboxylate transporter substrate binding protein [Burkholderiales bacterium]
MLRGASLLLAILAVGHPLAAPAQQGYPNRPMRFIVPFAPGGTNDIIARLVAARLHEALGQVVIVDNRGGAGGVIGTELAAKASPDGHTLLMANLNLATNPALVKKLPYDTLKDLQAVALLATSPAVLATAPSMPFQSVAQLIDYARANPGKLTYGTSGVGTTTHIPMELLIHMTGLRMVPVHYKGGGPMLIDLVAGRISPAFTTILSVMPHLRAQRLRALAVSTAERSSALPDVPTVAESGVKGYDFSGWWGIVVPAGTPRSIVARLSAELGKILARTDVRDRLAGQGADPRHAGPEEFASYIRAEIAKWGKVTREAGIRVD